MAEFTGQVQAVNIIASPVMNRIRFKFHTGDKVHNISLTGAQASRLIRENIADGDTVEITGWMFEGRDAEHLVTTNVILVR